MIARAALLAALAGLGLSAAGLPAFAQDPSAIPAPGLKPAVPNHSRHLADADFHALRRGLAAVRADDWDAVRSWRSQASDPAVRKILQWRIAASDRRASRGELQDAVESLEGWPQLISIQRELEYQIADSSMSPAEIAAWYDANPPVTGDGRVSHGEALLALGRQDEGREQILQAWRGQTLRLSRQSEVLRRHGGLMTAADHAERVDFLLWSDQRTAASQLLPQLEGGERSVANARLRLAGREAGVDGAVNAVPASLQTDAGLLYERARWRRLSGMEDGALELTLQLPASHDNEAALASMWTERKLLILDRMRERDHRTAYRLAASNGMDRGAAFADAEYLAGWLALVYLNEPDTAYGHFTKLAENVSFPVSVARGRYWQGRAADATGDPETARAHYLQAAEHATTYYGQLAVVALGGDAAELDLPPDPEISDDMRAEFEAREQVRAMIALDELGQNYLFQVFISHLQNDLETPAEHAMLSDIAERFLRTRESVRAAKSAQRLGEALAERAWPVIDIPADAPVQTDEALTLAVIRQETEFHAQAVSHAGARGLMQMMPATAASTARDLGLPYEFEWLTDDPDYNMRLGMAHLDKVVDDYSGSLVIALAAYNAGESRANRWIADYGDPRTGAIDPIDWVESLPYSETRNYVQRVIENVQVYRARRSGGAAPLGMDRDMIGRYASGTDLPRLSAEGRAAADAAAGGPAPDAQMIEPGEGADTELEVTPGLEMQPLPDADGTER